MSEAVNGVVDSLDKDIKKAVQEFLLKPTNSGRMKLQQDLRSIATALEVESGAGDFDADEQATVLKAVDVLRDLADQALYVQPEVMASNFDLRMPGPKNAGKKAPHRELRNRDAVRLLPWVARALRSLFR